MIRVTPSILLAEDELIESFHRASGPGGQNVNKVETAVMLRFDVRASPNLPERVRARLERLAGRRLTQEGVLVLTCQQYRSQDRTRQTVLAMLIDQHFHRGARLRFFGHEALTALSAADLALRYDADLVPMYAIRAPDGISFHIVVESPIPPGTPEAMTQALNDSLEAHVRQNMDQWFWVHRRWKGGSED